MHRETKEYWIKLIDALYQFAEGIISYEEYRQRILSLRNELGEGQGDFDTSLPFIYVPLCRALTCALAEVAPDACEEDQDMRDIARWFFKEYFDCFICWKKSYTEPERVWGGSHFRVLKEGQSMPEPVRSFLSFANEFMQGPPILSPSDIRFLHSLYLRLTPDTVLGVLCIEAIQALLPWLSEGIAHEKHLSAFEIKSREVDAENFNRFKEWVERLRGEREFRVRLIYYKDVILVRID